MISLPLLGLTLALQQPQAVAFVGVHVVRSDAALQ